MIESPDILLKSLYETQYKKLFKVAYHMIGRIDIAQDLVQDTFLIAISHQKELLVHPLPEGWLMTTLKNLVLNERRRIKVHSEIPLEAIMNLPGEPPEMPLDLLLPKSLSTKERDVLIWRFEKQLEYCEIADRLGISETGCRSCVYRAIAHCKKYIKTFDF